MKQIAGTVAAALVMLVSASAHAGDAPIRWADFRFLFGEWVGQGGGGPGQGSGTFSFAPDLQGNVLVRRNRAEYPATASRPAVVHEDLMIVYPAQDRKDPHAIYFDTEGHTIQYQASASADGNSWTFLSDASPSAPRFRLTYTKTGDDTVSIKFEVAPPGKPEEFKTYINATAKRKATSGGPDEKR